MDLMRQGQQNRRGRGRNNNTNGPQQQNSNRRGGQNPLTRSFESTGPDTKIRGTPAHIAEKYMALARDAHSSGDPVLSENYLQHAEHYNRIIMAYREQLQQSGELNGGSQPNIARFRPGPQDPMGDDFGEGDGDDFGNDIQGQPMIRNNEPQPSVFDGGQRDGQREGPRDAPREAQRFEDRGPRHEGQPQRHQQQNRDRSGGDRNFSHDRRDRPERFDRQDRPERQDRNDRSDRMEPRLDSRPDQRPEPRIEPRIEPRAEARVERQPMVEAPPADAGAPPRRAPRPAAPAATHEQPEFLRRPVRRPRREVSDEAGPAAPAPPTSDEPGRD